MSTPRPREAGFTLIEILVTMLVVLSGLAGLMMMAVGSTRASVDSMNFNRATAFGEELLEQLREAPYDQVETLANIVSGAACAAAGGLDWNVYPNDGDLVNEDLPGNATQITFERDVTVECIENSNIKRVTIEVRWDDEVSRRRGSMHSVEFETFRTPDPM